MSRKKRKKILGWGMSLCLHPLLCLTLKFPVSSQSSQSIPITSDREVAGVCSENSKLKVFLIAAKG